MSDKKYIVLGEKTYKVEGEQYQSLIEVIAETDTLEQAFAERVRASETRKGLVLPDIYKKLEWEVKEK